MIDDRTENADPDQENKFWQDYLDHEDQEMERYNSGWRLKPATMIGIVIFAVISLGYAFFG